MEDRELIEAVLSGDLEAFGPLMDRYYAMVYRLCLNMTGNVPDAEELAHDSFVEAYLKLGQLREPERFGGWLKKLALNLCRMWYRQSKNRALELAEDQVAAVEDHGEDSMVHARMSYGLSTLSAAHRLVLVLHYYEGLSYDEVATFLELPKGTVMSRLHRARQALKEVIEQMTEQEVIPVIPDDRFKEVVHAEIALLLGMFHEQPNATERLTIVLRKSPERLADLVADAQTMEIFRNLAILLPHLGSDAVDTVLDCRFSTEQLKMAKMGELLRCYASRCTTVPQRDSMSDMASRETYLLLDRVIAHAADDHAKARLLLEMMESCDDPCSALLFADTLLCYGEPAFELLMDRFLAGAAADRDRQSSRVLHALLRTGALFAARMPELLGSDSVERQLAGLTGSEAVARSLCASWQEEANRKQFLNDLRTREKWPPVRVEDIGSDLIGEVTRLTAALVADGAPELRAQAIRVLGYLRAGEHSALIRGCLSDADLAIRLAAIFAVSEIGDAASADALIERVQDGECPERVAAVAALGRLQVERAEHILVETVRSQEEPVREAAVAALGEMGTVSSQIVLQELMRGTDRRLQRIAAKAVFGGVRPRKAVLSDTDRRLAEKRRKVTPVATISPDAVLRFGISEIRTYEEADLTERIAGVCSDHCATRRYMIELGLMTRSAGVYEFTETGKAAWRVERFIYERFLSPRWQEAGSTDQ